LVQTVESLNCELESLVLLDDFRNVAYLLGFYWFHCYFSYINFMFHAGLDMSIVISSIGWLKHCLMHSWILRRQWRNTMVRFRGWGHWDPTWYVSLPCSWWLWSWSKANTWKNTFGGLKMITFQCN